ncbi:MAG: insulinase family protein [Halioglobus sp.]
MPAIFFQRGLAPLLILAILAVLAACASIPDSGPKVVQSPNDSNRYRLLTLENDLQVLLISDPSSPKAAASLDVKVGSGDNPAGRGGLAHFLEHMLFLGTDKYPDAAEYEEYITEHGGTRNAYTSFEHTNYFFDIDAEYLPEALDRFAQFFIAPRFDAEYVEREKNAVQAEYQMGLKSDARRGLDVLQEVMNPEHPYSQFSVGSLESLADRPQASVRDDLLSFYEKHYSANAMRLVVLGSESLNDLEKLVRPMFTVIPNRDYQPADIEAPLFANGDLPMLVQVEPQATLRQLQVSFPIKDYRGDYHVKPVGYLGNLVGHEGEGSLLSQLKAEGLAESLAAGSGLGWRGGALFSVTVTLTQAGLDDYDRVLQLLFEYMAMLREKGPQEWLYDEQTQLAQLRFRFKEASEPMGYVSMLSSGMHYYAPKDILQGPYIMDDYEAAMLSGLMEDINPENALIVLSDKSAQTNRKSVHYDVAYSRAPVENARTAAWATTAPEAELALPIPNAFIAEDVSMAELPPKNPEHPLVAWQQGRQKIWFLQDDEFRVPKGATYVNFRSPLVGQSANQTALAVLYTSLLTDAVNEFTYPALLAGLNFSVYKHAQGISLRISGYNDKQMVLLAQLLEVIERSKFDPARFENIRTDMVRALNNAVAKRPSSQVIDDLREALLYGQWGEATMIRELEALQLADVETYADAFWSSATAEALLFGNYEKAAVAELSSAIDGLIAEGPAPDLPPLEVLRLGEGEMLQFVVEVPHDDAVVAWYLQGDGNSWSDRAATALTAQTMKSGFFQQLRTEQQLGYIASAFAWPQLDVPALVMLVQSPSHSARDVANSMQAFMEQLDASLEGEQFERHKRALINEILQPDKNLWERAEFYWQSIAKKQFNFDGRMKLADAVEALTKEEWLEYYNRVFLEQRHSMQVVSPGRKGELPVDAGKVMRSATAIKSGHATYVIK